MKIDFSKIVELSHRMIPGKEPFTLKTRIYDVNELGERGEPHSPGTWYVSGEVFFQDHCGTHVEFPLHHVEGGMDASSFPLSKLIGEAAILDFSDKKAGDCMSLAEFKKYDGLIKEGDIVFLYTGSDKRWRTKDWEPYPYVACDAMQWLITEKKIVAIGTDATSLENFHIPDQPNHNLIFHNGLAMVESLTNLDKISGERVLVIMLPLKIEGIEACPCRIIAVRQGGLVV
jgi:arylformamidase